MTLEQTPVSARTDVRRPVATSDTTTPTRPFYKRGMLLTGGDPLYIEAELGGDATVSSEPLWTPAGKIVGRYLSPFLTPPLQR